MRKAASSTANRTLRRLANAAQRPREYLTEMEVERLIDAARKRGRSGARDACANLSASLVADRSEAWPLARQPSQGGIESVHPLQGSSTTCAEAITRQGPLGVCHEAGPPTTTAWFLRMVQRTGKAAAASTGYKLVNDGHDTQSLAHYLGHRNLQSTARYTALRRTVLDPRVFGCQRTRNSEGCGLTQGTMSAWEAHGLCRLHPPDRIRVFHFTSAEFAINDIALSRLKVARFSDVNDPFELLGLNFRERHVRNIIRGFKDLRNSDTGLLSFSQNWTNPVLWSHYAAKHRGICLGFDLKRGMYQQVEYLDKRILAELEERDDDPTKIAADLQELLLRTKSEHWSYEQEIRVFVTLTDMKREGTLYFCPFGDEHLHLAEVILGSQCDVSLGSVRALTRSHCPEAVVYGSRLAFKSFSVVPQENTIP